MSYMITLVQKKEEKWRVKNTITKLELCSPDILHYSAKLIAHYELNPYLVSFTKQTNICCNLLAPALGRNMASLFRKTQWSNFIVHVLFFCFVVVVVVVAVVVLISKVPDFS